MLNSVADRNCFLVSTHHTLKHLRQCPKGHDLHGHPDGKVGKLAVSRSIMRHERLTGSFGLVMKPLQPLAMMKFVIENGWIGMAKRPMLPAETVGDSRPKILFDNFKSLCHDVPEEPVELVGGPDMLERNTGEELVPGMLEGQTITTKTIIINVVKKFSCQDWILYGQTSRLEHGNLISM